MPLIALFRPKRRHAPRRGRLLRTPLRQLSFARLFRGGRVRDLGRLPRYAGFFSAGAFGIWAAIGAYLTLAPLSYTSRLSLILPGAGATATVNLNQIGQASSSASSPYTNSSVSPTETYKRLIGAERILDAAAKSMTMASRDFGKPRVELVDQTGLINVSITGRSPENAKARGDALLAAFFAEVEALRADEEVVRETGTSNAIGEYRKSVLATRDQISALQRQTGLISAAQYDSLVAETDALEQSVRELGATLDAKTQAVKALESSLGTTPRLAAAALRLHADTEFAALVDAMSKQAAALSQARAKFGTNHPEVTAARAGQVAAQAAVLRRAQVLTGLDAAEFASLDLSNVGSRAALLGNLVTLEAERAGLAAQYDSMAAELTQAKDRRIALIGPSAQLQDLQRSFAVAEAVFASTMARSQTSKADRFASYPLVQVLEDPSLPEKPSSPRRTLAVAAGVAANLFLFIGLMLGWMRRPLIDRLLASGRAGQAVAPGLVAAE